MRIADGAVGRATVELFHLRRKPPRKEISPQFSLPPELHSCKEAQTSLGVNLTPNWPQSQGVALSPAGTISSSPGPQAPLPPSRVSKQLACLPRLSALLQEGSGVSGCLHCKRVEGTGVTLSHNPLRLLLAGRASRGLFGNTFRPDDSRASLTPIRSPCSYLSDGNADVAFRLQLPGKAQGTEDTLPARKGTWHFTRMWPTQKRLQRNPEGARHGHPAPVWCQQTALANPTAATNSGSRAWAVGGLPTAIPVARGASSAATATLGSPLRSAP